MNDGTKAEIGHGLLLVSRLLLAASFLPDALGRLTNISGFAATLTMKGVPYGDMVAAVIAVAEIVAPLALILGLAPRMAASALIATTVVTTAALHRFWSYGGLTRSVEQELFTAQLGIAAALLLLIVTGPGAWSWQAWWNGFTTRRKAPKRKRSTRAPAPRSRAPQKSLEEDDELANAA